MKHIRTPLLLQMEAVECGAAALGIVLRHYGCYTPLTELRQVCNVSRDGTNALNLIRAAEFYGLKAAGLRRSTLTGLAKIPTPNIIYVHRSHFAVLEHLDDTYAYVNDPAHGHRQMTREEFQTWYAGVVITCEPGENFRKRGAPFRLGSVLRSWLKGSEAAVLYILVASIFLLVPGFMLPALLRTFVDDVLVAGRDWFLGVAIGLAAAMVLRLGLLWLQQKMLLRLETRLALRQTNAFFEHLLSLPLPFFLNRRSGDLAYRLQINERIAGTLSHDVADTILNIVLMIFYAGVMMQYSVPLTLIGILFVLLNLLILQRIARQRSDLNQRLQQERAQLTGTTLNGLRAVETMKAAGAEEILFTRWSALNAQAISTEQAMSRLTQGYFALLTFLLAVNTTLTLIIGAQFVMDGTMTLGLLVAFQSLMYSFIQPVNQLAGVGTQLQEIESDLNRVDDILKYPAPAPGLANTSTPLLQAKIGQVDIFDLTFGYNRFESPLIGGFTLQLAPGTICVVRGASGSGKSTLVRLLVGLFEPWRGEIFVNGIPAGMQRHKISFADQTITLFAGSFFDNLTLWKPDIPVSDIIRAAQDAHIHDLILQRGGYNSRIQENGQDLSGGQRQCLEIARALARNPSLLILDETTNALDPETEAVVFTNLRKRGCTCIIVAHRSSVIQYADEVITL